MAENDTTAGADEAQSPLEDAVRRARARIPVPADASTWAVIDAVLSNLALSAYGIGAREMIHAHLPIECTECVWPDEPPTPEQLHGFTRQGWQPWDMANVMMPKTPGAIDKNTLGFRVRFWRRMAPLDQRDAR